jgi:hypothetical protein
MSNVAGTLTAVVIATSGVARICIWRELGAQSATGGANGAVGRARVGPGGGITPEKILEI